MPSHNWYDQQNVISVSQIFENIVRVLYWFGKCYIGPTLTMIRMLKMWLRNTLIYLLTSVQWTVYLLTDGYHLCSLLEVWSYSCTVPLAILDLFLWDNCAEWRDKKSWETCELGWEIMRSVLRLHCNLHSATCDDLLVSKTRTITYGPHSFAVSGPCVWNDLPSTLHASPGTLRQFQSTLKTILFCSAHGKWCGAFITLHYIRKLFIFIRPLWQRSYKTMSG